jgi:hypothetical protein
MRTFDHFSIGKRLKASPQHGPRMFGKPVQQHGGDNGGEASRQSKTGRGTGNPAGTTSAHP